MAGRAEAPGRVAIFRALQLGDMLCALPALRALRAGLPDARITLVGLPWAAAFACRYPHLIDRFLPFPGAPGLPEGERPGDYAAFLAAARAERFDLAIQMHGSGLLSNGVVRAMGARMTAGFHSPAAPRPDSGAFFAYPDGNEIHRLLRLMELLGFPARGDQLEFPLGEEEEAEAAAIRRDRHLPHGRYLCIHPGGRAPARRWPPERFAAVGERLAAEGWPIVLTGAPWERSLTGEVAARMRYPAEDLAGSLSLGGMAALIGGARLLICNDTGVSHIAAALRVPSVVIFTGSSPERWAPLDRRRHRIVLHPVNCRPCGHHICPIGHPCAEGVEAEAVGREARGLLNGSG